jgi:hypothetical protein
VSHLTRRRGDVRGVARRSVSIDRQGRWVVSGAISRDALCLREGRRSANVAFSLLYLAFRALLGALGRCRRGPGMKDAEVPVLRHELEVLRRHAARQSCALLLIVPCWRRRAATP